ncbi:MAG: hypothetical protein P8Q92_03055 [Pseudoprimorskyibacter sp.]|nr:hypothetical protein [Pseudoprimorskyibacter sp.]
MSDHPYVQLMDDNGVSIVFNLDLKQPVELSDFVASFAGLGAQFERHIRNDHPDLEGEVKAYVKEVRKGSIEAELIPLAYNTIITALDHHQIATKFVKNLAQKISIMREKGGRIEGATKTELTELARIAGAVANDPDGKATISAMNYKKTPKTVEFSMVFDTADASQALESIDAQFIELSQVTDFDHENKLLTFFQSNRKDSDKSGEKGIIEDLNATPLSIVYASELAKERIKSEMLNGDKNVYKLGFFVDVNVQMKGGRPVAYRIKSVNDVIDIPDDD